MYEVIVYDTANRNAQGRIKPQVVYRAATADATWQERDRLLPQETSQRYYAVRGPGDGVLNVYDAPPCP